MVGGANPHTCFHYWTTTTTRLLLGFFLHKLLFISLSHIFLFSFSVFLPFNLSCLSVKLYYYWATLFVLHVSISICYLNFSTRYRFNDTNNLCKWCVLQFIILWWRRTHYGKWWNILRKLREENIYPFFYFTSWSPISQGTDTQVRKRSILEFVLHVLQWCSFVKVYFGHYNSVIGFLYSYTSQCKITGALHILQFILKI